MGDVGEAGTLDGASALAGPEATADEFVAAVEPLLAAASARFKDAGWFTDAKTWKRGGGAIGCLWAFPETLRVRAWLWGDGGSLEADILTSVDADRWVAPPASFDECDALVARAVELAHEGSERLASIAAARAFARQSRDN